MIPPRRPMVPGHFRNEALLLYGFIQTGEDFTAYLPNPERISQRKNYFQM